MSNKMTLPSGWEEESLLESEEPQQDIGTGKEVFFMGSRTVKHTLKSAEEKWTE